MNNNKNFNLPAKIIAKEIIRLETEPKLLFEFNGFQFFTQRIGYYNKNNGECEGSFEYTTKNDKIMKIDNSWLNNINYFCPTIVKK